MMSQIAARAWRTMVCLCFGLAVASAADAASRQSAQALSDDPVLEYAPDTVLIKFKPSAQPAQKRQAYAAVGGQKIRGYDLVRGLEHLQLGRGQRVEQAVERLQQLPFVEYVEPDHVLRADTNDTYYYLQWGLENTGQDIRGTVGTDDADIDAEFAWVIKTGDPNFVVAVIDTGTDYNHPDLDSNIWTNPGEIPSNGVDDDGNGYIDDIHGYDFWSNDADPMDENGHGTHVAGTICAESNNEQGVAGVAWQCKIMALRFLGPNGGYTSDAISALDYAVSKGVKVSNNSWGGGGYSQSLYNAIQNANTSGHLFVAASGNSSDDTDSKPHYPSSYSLGNIISVAATENQDRLSSFSNFGANTVDVGAPGTNIVSTSQGGYWWMSGTSMAAPHVTGLAVLIWDLHPTWDNIQVRDRIYNTVRPLAALAGITVTGGIINAYEALLEPVAAPSAPTALSATAISDSEIDLAWTDSSGNESGFKIDRSPDGAGWVEMATVGMDVTTYSDSSLDAETTYHYQVMAYNSVGESAYSNTASATTESTPTYQQVVASAETPGGGSVVGTYQDTWFDDDNSREEITERLSGGKRPSRYSYLQHTWTFEVPPGITTLYLDAGWGPSSDGDSFDFSYSLNGTDFIEMSDTGQFPSDATGTVYIRVTDTDRMPGNQALDTVSIGHISIASYQEPGDPPTAPSGLTAIAMGSGQIDLDWVDAANNELGFEIDRSTDGENWDTLTTVTAGTISYSDASVSSNTTYYYRVRAFNGSGYSASSNVALTKTDVFDGILLSATGSKTKGWQDVKLEWEGATIMVDIYRNNYPIASGESGGEYWDVDIAKGGASYTYQVCNAESTTNCSNEAQVVF